MKTAAADTTSMSLYALGTQSDWAHNGGAWGIPGHQRVVDLSKQAGISRLYWRTHNGGQACYPSEVCTVMDGHVYRDPNFKGFGALPKSYFAYATHIDYSKWDQIADMSRIATASGLEYGHWYTVFEDDHGGHLRSDFLLGHPQFRCTLASGEQAAGFLDFWYPEVREYKLRVLREILERPCRRVLLDFVRRNGTPSADRDGHYRYGYNPEILAGFREETGLDAGRIKPGTPDWEAWLDYNARPLTEFVRAAHQLAAGAGAPVDLLVWPVECRAWQALDLPAITRAGLVENILVGSHRYAASGAEARRQLQALRGQNAGTATIVPGLPGYHGLSPAHVDNFLAAAADEGCRAVMLHESNHVLESPVSDSLRSWHFGVPNCRREVRATRDPEPPPLCRGFLKCFSPEDPACDQETEFAVSWDDSFLTVRAVCRERDPGRLRPVPGIGKENYNANQLGARAFWSPYESLHLFVDAAHAHEDYCHFSLDADGGAMAETRLDEDWRGGWEHEVTIGADHWQAVFRIPWSTLGTTPAAGRVMGFQIVRMQNAPRETSSWFCAYGRRMNPAEFGHLRLS